MTESMRTKAARINVALLLAATTSCASAMSLTSDSFSDGGPMPALHADSEVCAGQGISPPIAWHDLPRGARSVVVTMKDVASGELLWLAYDIPAERNELLKGEGDRTGVGIVVGRNGAGSSRYRGMCPPVGDAPHRYVIEVVASDLAPQALPADLGENAVVTAQQGHLLGRAGIAATFVR